MDSETLIGISLVAALIACYAAVSDRLRHLNMTGPIAFLVIGLLVGRSGLDLIGFSLGNEGTGAIAEITLALVLFGDASRNIPARVRQALNVESGLNDGLVAPVVAVLLALVAGGIGASAQVAAGDRSSWAAYGAKQIGFGTLVGLGVGASAVVVIQRASDRGWASPGARRIAVLALAVLAWAGASAIGGNGFIAAFVGGLAAGSLTRDVGTGLNEFLDAEGELLSLLVWMLFGAAFVGPMLSDLTWNVVLYAVASLTVVRMAPVAVSLVGTRLRLDTVSLLGWFGPRGLASIVYGLAAVEILEGEGIADDLLLTVGATVTLSVIAHGVTARPLSRWYAQRSSEMRPQVTGVGGAEFAAAPDMPTRPARSTFVRSGGSNPGPPHAARSDSGDEQQSSH